MLANPAILNIQDNLKISVFADSKNNGNKASDFKNHFISAVNDRKVNFTLKKEDGEIKSDSSISAHFTVKTETSPRPEYKLGKIVRDEGNDAKGNSEIVQKIKEEDITAILNEMSVLSNMQNLVFNSNLLNQLKNGDVSVSEGQLNKLFSITNTIVSDASVSDNTVTAFAGSDKFEMKKLISNISGSENISETTMDIKELVSELSKNLKTEESPGFENLKNGENLSIRNIVEKIVKLLQQSNSAKDIKLNTEEFKNLLVSFVKTDNKSTDVSNVEKISEFVEKNLAGLKSEFEKAGIKFESSNIKEVRIETDEESLLSSKGTGIETRNIREEKNQKSLNYSNEFKNLSADDFLDSDTNRLIKSDFQTGFESLMNVKLAESMKESAKVDQTVDSQKIIDTIVNDVTQTLKTGKTELEVKLAPENLGKLTIKVTMEEGKLSANIEVKNPEVKQIIENNILKMKDDLSQNGINFEKINILLSNQENFTSHQGKYFREEQNRQQNFSQFNFIPEAEETEIVRSLGYNTIEYIA